MLNNENSIRSKECIQKALKCIFDKGNELKENAVLEEKQI